MKRYSILVLSDRLAPPEYVNNGKIGSDADTAARDSAVVASIALQHSVPVDVIRKALLRDSHGRSVEPVGCRARSDRVIDIGPPWIGRNALPPWP
jgi:hypothetical protein